LKAVPAWIRVTLTTAASSGSTSRATIDWSATVTSAAASTGSRPRCGQAACVPTPRISISNRSLDAKSGPLRVPAVPRANPGQPCRP
jgi:hypothetical protein